MNNEKACVTVKADFREEGTVMLRVIVWESVFLYQGDCVMDIRPAAAAKVGRSVCFLNELHSARKYA